MLCASSSGSPPSGTPPPSSAGEKGRRPEGFSEAVVAVEYCSYNIALLLVALRREGSHSAGLGIAGSVRQYEGSAAEWAGARVCRLPEVQAAGQDHKVVRGDGRHPTGIPAVTHTSDDIAPLGRIDSNSSTTLMFVINK